MIETKIRETCTIINGYNWDDCNSQLQKNAETIERLKVEGRNPPFKHPTIIRNPFSSNPNKKQSLVISQYLPQTSRIQQGSGYDSLTSTQTPRTRHPFQNDNQTSSNHRSLLRELQNNNNRIFDISESLSKPRNQYLSEQKWKNNLPQSLIQSESKTPNVFLKSIQSYQGQAPYGHEKRIYIKCKDLEYEEYQDAQNSANNYKAIRIGANGEWEETKETPEIIKPIIALKNRINQLDESEVFTSRLRQRAPAASGKMIVQEKSPIFSSSSSHLKFPSILH